MKRVYSSLLAVLFTAVAFAQESGGGVKVDVTKTTTTSGGFPWLWVIIGVVVLIILIVLLGGGGGGRDTVERTTVIKD